MCDICGDNRFEIIEAYKRKLIEATNIETSPEEMAVIDNVLFRFWQMGWLPSAQPEIVRCRDCKYRDENWRRVSVRWLPCMDVRTGSNWYCGSAERGEHDG